jgi:hypothetical protein
MININPADIALVPQVDPPVGGFGLLHLPECQLLKLEPQMLFPVEQRGPEKPEILGGEIDGSLVPSVQLPSFALGPYVELYVVLPSGTQSVLWTAGDLGGRKDGTTDVQ